ncbi:MAG: hypothetical protein QM496_02010 [Verrucomicrobiota bacterium]
MSDVTPDLAEKVLTADLRNVITKVGKGATLSGNEREMMAQLVAGDTDTDELLKTRVASLLRKWAKGGRLTDAEFAELGAWVPDRKQAAKKSTATTYPHKLSHYAELLGYKSDRTIKRMIKRGREKNPPDPPPLDNPGEVAGWWRRVMTQKVPESLLKLESGDKAEGQGDVSSGISFDSRNLPKGLGFEAALGRARQAEQLAAGMVQHAIKNEPASVEMRQRAWERAFEALRKAEKDAESVLLTAGRLVNRDELEAEFIERLNTVHQGLRSLPVRVATKLSISGDLFQQMTETWNEALDKCFESMGAADFGPAFELESEE